MVGKLGNRLYGTSQDEPLKAGGSAINPAGRKFNSELKRERETGATPELLLTALLIQKRT